MANSLIINNSTVINSSLDFIGRNINSSGTVTVGSTTITSTSINVQNLTFGSISSSGGGFSIAGGGSFSGALTAGSISTGGTFSAGNSTFNGNITLGNISMQNGSITVGTSTLNGSGLTSNGIGFGTAATVGYYGDTTNLGLRLPSASGNILLQTPGGASNMAIFGPSLATINTGLNVNGTLNVTNGNIALVNGQLFTDYAGNGGIRILNGGANQTGYIEFRTANTAQNRAGYIGYGNIGSGSINIAAESGYVYNFTGSTPQISGSPIVTQAGLNSAINGLASTGGSTWTGNLIFNSSVNGGSPGVRFIMPNNSDWLVRTIGGNQLQFCDGAVTTEYFSFSTDGTFRTRQMGDVANYINTVATNNQNAAVNRSVTSFRMVYIADMDITAGWNQGVQEYYGGSCVTGRASITSGDGNDIILRNMRFRQNQINIPSQGWIAAYFA